MKTELTKGNNRIGCALGGGGARGLAHIGVLKVMEEKGIYPDIIAGTSMGAIIGALYASGFRAQDIEHLVLGLDWKNFRRLADPGLAFNGLIQGKRVTELLESILGKRTFEGLNREFACAATDIRTGELVVLRKGSLIEAVRASISLPGVLVPVKIGKRYLVDGGLILQVPVSICRDMGADFTIAVNVIPDPAKTLVHAADSNNPVPVSSGTADVQIQPEVNNTAIVVHRGEIDRGIRKFFRPPAGERNQQKGPGEPPGEKPPSLVEILVQTFTITGYIVAAENTRLADLKIDVPTHETGFWQFDKAAALIAAGEKAARDALEKDKSVPARTDTP